MKIVYSHIVPLLLVLILSSCTHSVHHLSFIDPPKSVLDHSNSKIIDSSGEQFVFLGFAFDTNYVEFARRSLERKCPKGRIEGISVRYSTSFYFLSWKNKIHMNGQCTNNI